MRLVGGYAMTFENARAWALRHCPGIRLHDKVTMISVDISRYWRERGGNLRCEVVLLSLHEARVMFISHSGEDPTGRWFRHRKFRENKVDIKIKDHLFNHEEDQGIFEFITAPHPLLDPPYTDPPQTDPPHADPPQTDPPQTDPPHADPPQTDPPHVDPPNTDPPHVDPPNTDPPHADPPNTDPPQTDPPHADPPHTDPPNTDPPQTDPPNTDPPHTDPPHTE